jgi:hypothetical protein
MNFLEFYVRRIGEEFSNFILIDEDDRFLIDCLLDERISKGKIEYFVKWVRYSDYNNI